MEPVRANGFVGSVLEGGAVNFRDIFFNPHGHGTHTESYGHISKEIYAVNEVFDNYFYKATLCSVVPRVMPNGDHVVFADQLESLLSSKSTEAIIIRTLPNHSVHLRVDATYKMTPMVSVHLTLQSWDQVLAIAA